MKNYLPLALLNILLASLPFSAIAHHSVAEFDIEQNITVQATVTEVWFNNPHVRFYATQVNAEGEEIVWDLHTSSPNSLIRRGWFGDSIKVGDKVSFIGSPTRSGEPRLLVHTAEVPDGSVVSSRR